MALDDRGFEDLALELGHLQAEPAGLGGQAPVVVAGAVHLPLPGALVSGGVVFCVKRFWPLMADLTFRRNRKAMMLHGSGESSIPAHAKRGTIHGVAGSRDLRNAVLAARENGSS